ncbi:hypothetical protein KC354_g11475 [Hortaea werneckii]|nr:hypothetical protein KC354_g11475 [Hortaea werneckii]
MTQRDARTNFFDLPQEVRDIIYTYWPKTAWIDVTQPYPCNTQTINREHDKWIHAIGDENAARLRHLSFVSYSFSLHVAISYEDENPKIAVKLRPFDDNPKLAKSVPSGYSMAVAHSYASQGMRWMLDEIESRRVGARGLTAADVAEICRSVERIRPFLCTRRSLGFRKAVLPSGDPGTWPTAKAHLKKCHVCGDGYVDRTKR